MSKPKVVSISGSDVQHQLTPVQDIANRMAINPHSEAIVIIVEQEDDGEVRSIGFGGSPGITLMEAVGLTQLALHSMVRKLYGEA